MKYENFEKNSILKCIGKFLNIPIEGIRIDLAARLGIFQFLIKEIKLDLNVGSRVLILHCPAAFQWRPLQYQDA